MQFKPSCDHLNLWSIKFSSTTPSQYQTWVEVELFQIPFIMFYFIWLKVLWSPSQCHWLCTCIYKKCEKIDASPIKWSIALKQFVGKSQRIFWVCLAILRSWHLKGWTKKTLHWRWHDLVTDNIYFSRGLTIPLENWKKTCVPDDINYGGFIDLARFSNTDPREY